MSTQEAWEDLERHLIGDEADLPEHLGDLADVDRTLRAISWRRRKIAQAEQVANAVIERTREHLEAERLRFDPSYLEERLRGYHEARLADDPKAKSLAFPAGTLRARKAPDRVEVDEDVFLPVAPDDLVRVKRSPDKTAIAAHVKATGEVLPGVELVAGDVRYSIEVTE